MSYRKIRTRSIIEIQGIILLVLGIKIFKVLHILYVYCLTLCIANYIHSLTHMCVLFRLFIISYLMTDYPIKSYFVNCKDIMFIYVYVYMYIYHIYIWVCVWAFFEFYCYG